MLKTKIISALATLGIIGVSITGTTTTYASEVNVKATEIVSSTEDKQDNETGAQGVWDSERVSLLYGSNPNAKRVTIVYDYTCPYCGELEQKYGKALKEAAERGDIYLELMPVKIHEDDYDAIATESFLVFATTSPDKAVEYNSAVWERISNPYLNGELKSVPNSADLALIAEEVGIENRYIGLMQNVLETGSAVELVQQGQKNFVSRGFGGTPTVLFDDKEVEANEWTAEFQKLTEKSKAIEEQSNHKVIGIVASVVIGATVSGVLIYIALRARKNKKEKAEK